MVTFKRITCSILTSMGLVKAIKRSIRMLDKVEEHPCSLWCPGIPKSDNTADYEMSLDFCPNSVVNGLQYLVSYMSELVPNDFKLRHDDSECVLLRQIATFLPGGYRTETIRTLQYWNDGNKVDKDPHSTSRYRVLSFYRLLLANRLIHSVDHTPSEVIHELSMLGYDMSALISRVDRVLRGTPILPYIDLLLEQGILVGGINALPEADSIVFVSSAGVSSLLVDEESVNSVVPVVASFMAGFMRDMECDWADISLELGRRIILAKRQGGVDV